MLGDPQRLTRGEHFHPAEEIGERRSRQGPSRLSSKIAPTAPRRSAGIAQRVLDQAFRMERENLRFVTPTT